MLTVEQIYEAMKPNFLWEKNPLKPLQTRDEYTDSISIAPTVFIGLSLLYGVPEEDVMIYLDINHEEYRNKLKRFREHIAAYLNDRENNVPLNFDDPKAPQRYYSKFMLSKNYITLYFRETPWLSLGEIFIII